MHWHGAAPDQLLVIIASKGGGLMSVMLTTGGKCGLSSRSETARQLDTSHPSARRRGDVPCHSNGQIHSWGGSGDYIRFLQRHHLDTAQPGGTAEQHDEVGVHIDGLRRVSLRARSGTTAVRFPRLPYSTSTGGAVPLVASLPRIREQRVGSCDTSPRLFACCAAPWEPTARWSRVRHHCRTVSCVKRTACSTSRSSTSWK